MSYSKSFQQLLTRKFLDFNADILQYERREFTAREFNTFIIQDDSFLSAYANECLRFNKTVRIEDRYHDYFADMTIDERHDNSIQRLTESHAIERTHNMLRFLVKQGTLIKRTVKHKDVIHVNIDLTEKRRSYYYITA